MQYHGGTNFGRFASSYVTTSYYDGAPLDEYGNLDRHFHAQDICINKHLKNNCMKYPKSIMGIPVPRSAKHSQ